MKRVVQGWSKSDGAMDSWGCIIERCCVMGRMDKQRLLSLKRRIGADLAGRALELYPELYEKLECRQRIKELQAGGQING